MKDNLETMVADLQHLIDKGLGDSPVTIYCSNCDCSDKYNGAIGTPRVISIVINK